MKAKKVSTKSLVKKIQTKVKRQGITKVTHDLGYLSTNTVRSWIKKEQVPTQAIDKVKNYLTQAKA